MGAGHDARLRFKVFDVGNEAADATGHVIFDKELFKTFCRAAVALDAENCMVHAERRLTTVLVAKDLVVATTPRCGVVLPRARAEEVKGLVAALKAGGHAEASNYRRISRP